MEERDWKKVLDYYLNTGKMTSENYEMLDEYQTAVIQELKRAFKRIKNNETISKEK